MSEAATTPSFLASTSLAALIAAAAARMRGHLGDEAGSEARALIARMLGIDRTTQLIHPTMQIEGVEAARVLALAARRAVGEPFAYLVGTREFYGLDFLIGPGVLVPRPDSETLIEAVLAHLAVHDAPYRILDLGTGSGCLLLSILKHRANAWGIGVDRSAQALDWAERNRRTLGLESRAALVKGDWLQPVAGAFDAIVCNPPYIATGDAESLMVEVGRYEPPEALFAGTDGLDAYRLLLPGIAKRLKPGGAAFFEIGATQGAAVQQLAQIDGTTEADILKDLAGNDRCLRLIKV